MWNESNQYVYEETFEIKEQKDKIVSNGDYRKRAWWQDSHNSVPKTLAIAQMLIYTYNSLH